VAEVSRRLRSLGGKGWATVVLLIVAVSIVAGLPYAVASKDARRPEQEPQIVTLPLPAGVTFDSLQKARVEKVVDGDSIDAVIAGTLVHVRYFGVDAPERGERCYREAADRNQTLIGREVLLLPDARETDRFGRLLRYVFLADGTSVEATLIAEGFGRAWRDDGRYRDDLLRLEEEAEAAGRGCLWK
jgi:micrococcal nuclease